MIFLSNTKGYKTKGKFSLFSSQAPSSMPKRVSVITILFCPFRNFLHMYNAHVHFSYTKGIKLYILFCPLLFFKHYVLESSQWLHDPINLSFYTAA